LQGYLQPAGLLTTGKPFTIDNAELTANLKIRRKIIAEKFQDAIASLYVEISQNQQTKTTGTGRTKELVIHCL
jgi:long-subunit acyl-CoA synthetase (AMP-forming)